MLDDILEESWTYQEIVKKAREKERHVRIREQRENVLNLVHMRFPSLITMTELRIETINDPDVLHGLVTRLFSVQTADEAKQAIKDASTAETHE